ncbi:MAG: hypothetical protein IKE01_02985 [Clostridia bacterium]|nr:hypothetical protein [Clostridia bacterium]
MKNILKFFEITLCIFLILFSANVHITCADEVLAFEKDVFMFDEFKEDTFLNMTVPTGYSLADLKFEVDDDDIVQVQNYAAIFEDYQPEDDYAIAMISKLEGETTVRAWIDGTNYEAQCRVKVINPITITWDKNADKMVISIQNKCAAWFLDTDYQSVELKVISLEDNSESDWIRLGRGQFAGALNKTYTYEIDNNKDYKIKVRWIQESPYIQEDYAEMGVENEAIIYGKESDIEPPTNIADDTYNFFSNKDKMEINVGSSDKIEITAEMKDGLLGIAQYELVKDYWDVEWKIEDETIAKCIPETGIENNIHGITQTVGKSTIQGLKSGNTMLIAKIKVSENKTEEIKIPIIVNGAEKENDKKVDDTVADKELAKTGESKILIFAEIVAIILLICMIIKIKNK